MYEKRLKIPEIRSVVSDPNTRNSNNSILDTLDKKNAASLINSKIEEDDLNSHHALYGLNSMKKTELAKVQKEERNRT